LIFSICQINFRKDYKDTQGLNVLNSLRIEILRFEFLFLEPFVFAKLNFGKIIEGQWNVKNSFEI
jgi:hypothetical protein